MEVLRSRVLLRPTNLERSRAFDPRRARPGDRSPSATTTGVDGTSVNAAPPPQPQRLGQALAAHLEPPAQHRLPTLGHQPHEPLTVQLAGLSHELIAGRAGQQPGRSAAEQLAQPRDIHLEQVAGAARQAIARASRRWSCSPDHW
jgi:hypothetical protein